jgi:hypothetical protein
VLNDQLTSIKQTKKIKKHSLVCICLHSILRSSGRSSLSGGCVIEFNVWRSELLIQGQVCVFKIQIQSWAHIVENVVHIGFQSYVIVLRVLFPFPNLCRHLGKENTKSKWKIEALLLHLHIFIQSWEKVVIGGTTISFYFFLYHVCMKAIWYDVYVTFSVCWHIHLPQEATVQLLRFLRNSCTFILFTYSGGMTEAELHIRVESVFKYI